MKYRYFMLPFIIIIFMILVIDYNSEIINKVLIDSNRTINYPFFDNDNIDNDYLILPPHLDEEEPRNISRFLHAFTQQRIWTRTLLARVGILLREAEDSLDKEKARVFNSLPVKLSVKEKELALFSDEDCVPMLERLKSIEAKKEMLELYMKNLEDAIFDISREISRRGYDMSSQTRVENVDSVRRHNYR